MTDIYINCKGTLPIFRIAQKPEVVVPFKELLYNEFFLITNGMLFIGIGLLFWLVQRTRVRLLFGLLFAITGLSFIFIAHFYTLPDLPDKLIVMLGKFRPVPNDDDVAKKKAEAIREQIFTKLSDYERKSLLIVEYVDIKYEDNTNVNDAQIDKVKKKAHMLLWGTVNTEEELQLNLSIQIMVTTQPMKC